STRDKPRGRLAARLPARSRRPRRRPPLRNPAPSLIERGHLGEASGLSVGDPTAEPGRQVAGQLCEGPLIVGLPTVGVNRTLDASACSPGPCDAGDAPSTEPTVSPPGDDAPLRADGLGAGASTLRLPGP